jgi:hypothetical protein
VYCADGQVCRPMPGASNDNTRGKKLRHINAERTIVQIRTPTIQ